MERGEDGRETDVGVGLGGGGSVGLESLDKLAMNFSRTTGGSETGEMEYDGLGSEQQTCDQLGAHSTITRGSSFFCFRRDQ